MNSQIRPPSKIVITGNGGIGKTTLLKLFCYNQYINNQKMTLGSEIFVKKAKINNQNVVLQIWDLSGEEQFRFFLTDFIQGAEGALLGFDIKRRKSFLDLKKWVPLLRKHNPDIPIILLGLKRDLGYHTMLSSRKAKKFVKKIGLINYVEVSSKENLNVELPFKHLLQNLEGCEIESIKFMMS